MAKILRVVLWNHLNPSIATLSDCNKKEDIILFLELNEAATSVKHHKKKLVFLFSSMRHFASELISQNYQVEYVKLTDPKNTQTLISEIESASKKYKADKIIITEPGDYATEASILKYKKSSKIPLELRENDHFLCTRNDFKAWASGKKQLRMAYFYREMRKKYSVLMAGNAPVGGCWDFDKENRNPPKENLKLPRPFVVEPDKITQDVIQLVKQKYSSHFGDIDSFNFPVTRKSALQAMAHFIEERLALFGKYQDAMLEGEAWMFHSHLSFCINAGLLHPMECIKAAESAYDQGKVPLNSVEGFIRQILGWREYIRGIYWLKMPRYKKLNYLNAKRELPSFFWDVKTDLNCLKQSIAETKKNAYAHHIQRLMVIGNFCLLAGIHPDEVNEWYLIVYADAFEWVELPNVTGMILYADQGFVGSKPYAASGAYIKKMSNYCENCKYSVNLKYGDKACPFNYLYWHFIIKNKNLLESNQRMRMIYSALSKMDKEKISKMTTSAKKFLDSLS